MAWRFHGIPLSLDVRDPTCRRILFGAHETGEIAFLRRLLRPGDVALDIGAHVGALAAALAGAVGTAGAVYAFEPNPQLERRLRMAERLSRGIIRVERAAVVDPETEMEGEVAFYADPTHPSWSTLDPRLASSVAPSRVPCVSVDTFVEKQGLGRVAFVKVDVEGAEMRVVAGMSRLLARPDRPVMLLELKPESWDPQEHRVFQSLGDLGYVPHRLRTRGLLVRTSIKAAAETPGTFNVVLLPPDDRRHQAGRFARQPGRRLNASRARRPS